MNVISKRVAFLVALAECPKPSAAREVGELVEKEHHIQTLPAERNAIMNSLVAEDLAFYRKPRKREKVAAQQRFVFGLTPRGRLAVREAVDHARVLAKVAA